MPKRDHRRIPRSLHASADGPMLVRGAADPAAPGPRSDLQAKLLPERYGMRENPFGMTPNPEYFYPTWTHREALSSLITGLECGAGFLSLIAPPGMGKTTLLFQLLERFRSEASTAFLFNVAATPQLLLRQLVRELHGAAAGDEGISLEEQLHAILLREFHAGRRCIVVVDESQHLEFSVLEALRMVSNFETSHSKLLHIVLSGQPQLAEKLADPQLAQLRQRISLIARLTPLGPEETAMYIAHRLHAGGYQGPPLFTPAAIDAIWGHSEGIPRVINTVCFNALLLGGSFDVASIDDDIVREVIADLDVTLFNRPRARFAARRATPGLDPGVAATQQESSLQLLAERALVAVGAAGVAILVKEAEGLVCRATSGMLVSEFGSRVVPTNGDFQRCLLTRSPVEGNSLVREGLGDAQDTSAPAAIYIPVGDCDTPLAVLEVVASREHPFTAVHTLKLKAIGEEIRRALVPPAGMANMAAKESGTGADCGSSAPRAGELLASEQPEHPTSAAAIHLPAETQPGAHATSALLTLSPEPALPPPAQPVPISVLPVEENAARRHMWISAGILAVVATVGLGIAGYAQALRPLPPRVEPAPPPPVLEGVASIALPDELAETLRVSPALFGHELVASHSTGAKDHSVAANLNKPTMAEPSRAILSPRPALKQPEVPAAVPPPALGGSPEFTSNGTLSGLMALLPTNTPNPPVSRGVTPAEILYREEPVYPIGARAINLQGDVTLEVVVAKDGTVREVRGIAGPSLLANAARDAVKKWRYRPFMLNGQPQDTKTQVIVKFVLPPR